MSSLERRGSTMRTLPIVFAADKNFSVPFGLAILSLLTSAAPTTYYDIYVLDDGVTHWIKDDIEKLKARFDFSITYYSVSELVKGYPCTPIFPAVTYARFLIPYLLPENITGRIFYTDADVVFCDDLTSLYDMDMAEKPVAAAQALNLTATDNRKYLSWLGHEYGLDFFERGNAYFHAGEILFDRELWTKGGYSERCLELAKGDIPKGIQFYDQDFFNIGCFGHIAAFPARYCVIPIFEKRYGGNYAKTYDGLCLYSETELHDALLNPAIIHYAGVKPIVFRKPQYKTEQAFFELWARSPWKNRIPYFPRPILLMESSPERLAILDARDKVHLHETVSVVIYTDNLFKNNQLDKLIKCVESLHKQDYRYLEIVVVDAGSSDGTLDLLSKYAEKHILRYIVYQNASQYAAFNKVLREDIGSYVMFFTAEHFVVDEVAISSMYELLKKTRVSMVCAAAMADKNPKCKGVSFARMFCVDKQYACINLNTTIFKTSVLRELGGFSDNGGSEEYDFVIKLKNAKLKPVFCNVCILNARSNCKAYSAASRSLDGYVVNEVKVDLLALRIKYYITKVKYYFSFGRRKTKYGSRMTCLKDAIRTLRRQ